jgi:hypothetical protein
MTKSTQFQSYNAYPASNYNINVANSTITTLASWNQTLSTATQIIEDVSNGTLKSTFQSLDGTSVTINTSGGTITLSGGSVANNIVSFKSLEAINVSGTQKISINGAISLNANTNEISGTYTSIFYQNGLTGLTPASFKFIGEITESAGTARGSISSLEITTINSTVNVATTNSYNLTNALVGWDYVNNTFLLSSSTLISGYSSIGKDKAGTLVSQTTFEQFAPVSANLTNIFSNVMVGNDTIILSGNGARIAVTGQYGNDTIIGDSGDNFFNNRVEFSKDIVSGRDNDTIDGGAGYDVVYFGSNKLIGTYQFSTYDSKANSFIVTDTLPLNNTGIDTLIGIEELQFGDKTFTSTELKQLLASTSTTNANAGIFKYGSSGAEWLNGTSNDDTLYGNGGNDAFTAYAGNDILDGGDGVDTASFAYPYANYKFWLTSASQRYSITVQNSLEGVDTLNNIEYLKFSDRTVTFESLYAGLPKVSKGPADSDLVYVFKSEKTGPAVNPASYSYYYTSNPEEAAYISAQANWPWVQKASTFEAAHSNPSLGTPVFKFWSDKLQAPYFTISTSERDQIISWSLTKKNGYDWQYAGEGFKVYTTSTPTDAMGKNAIPVYCVWMDDTDFNPANGLSGGLLFTADKVEYDGLVKLVGVKGAGVVFYGEVPGN